MVKAKVRNEHRAAWKAGNKAAIERMDPSVQRALAETLGHPGSSKEEKKAKKSEKKKEDKE